MPPTWSCEVTRLAHDQHSSLTLEAARGTTWDHVAGPGLRHYSVDGRTWASPNIRMGEPELSSLYSGKEREIPFLCRPLPLATSAASRKRYLRRGQETAIIGEPTLYAGAHISLLRGRHIYMSVLSGA